MKILLQGQPLPEAGDPEIRAAVLISANRDEADRIALDIADNEIVEIETDDGARLMIRGDELARRLPGSMVLARSGAAPDVLAIPHELVLQPPPELATADAARGIVTWTIRRVVLRGPQASALDLAREYEGWVPLGLKLWHQDGSLVPLADGLQPGEEQQDLPWLLFLHGTGSSTLGSFGKLQPGQPEVWRALHLAYPGRILAFDHRSLTEDPVQNALDLLGQLPQGAELHLVSHSRGGLVGELLALGHLAEPQGDTVLRPEDLALFEGAARDRAEELGRVLARRRIAVTRFVRVACPARGTCIADGRLGDWLGLVFNALAHSARILGEAPADYLEALARIAAAALAGGDRADALPGVAAMAPEFSPLVRMLNAAGRPLRGDATDALVVIAGDLELSLSARKLVLFFLDNFFGSDHDLVVNTALMEGGLPRHDPVLLVDRGPTVTHFGYFGNARSAAQLRDGLLAPARLRGIAPPDTQLAKAERAEKDRGVTRSPIPAETGAEAGLTLSEGPAAPALLRGAVLPLAVILPGISGSHLAAAGQRVWLNPGGICTGGVGRLAIDQPRVGPDGVIELYYGELRQHLSRTHETFTLAYDWRLPIQTTGAAVARTVLTKLRGSPQRPIHFVAHSMGGLVARVALRDPALLQAFQANAASRLLMLGTPNGGSLAMALGLLGLSRTVKMLAALSLSEDIAQISAIMRAWPGALQLLPPALLDGGAWQALAGPRGLDPAALAQARSFWALMRNNAGLPGGRCLYLAGMGQTCDQLFRDASAKLMMTTTPRGDGTVLWSSGIPAGVPAWYAPTEHGDLCKDRYLHPAISDLLLKGQTEVRRVTRDPGLRAAEPAAGPREAVSADMPLPAMPSTLHLVAMTMGGRPPALLESAPQATPEVRVSVVHDDLRHARHPILVGHGLGDAIRSAEQALDQRLNGRLRRRNALGLHPGLIGSWDVHLTPCAEGPDGVTGGIVVGTGVMSGLSTGALTATIRSGLLAYADAARDLLAPPATAAKDEGQAAAPRDLGVSAVLIGCGSGVVSVADSVSALLNGVEQVNRILSGQAGTDMPVRFAELQIIEAVEQVAVTAWHALGQRVRRMRDPFRREGPLQLGRGGFRRTGPEADPDSWMEVTITAPRPEPPAPGEPAPSLGPLHYLLVDGRARVEAETVAVSRRLVQHYVAQIPDQPATLDADGISPGRTLFELLWPAALKQHSLEDRNLRLVLDRDSATIPWEMLDDRRPDEYGRFPELLKPPAVRYGLMRQLVSQRDQPTPPRRGGPRSALVIGDPGDGSGGLPPLPNARDEALAVAAQLEEAGFAVTRLVGPDATPARVISALFSRGWSVVHIASHGVIDWSPGPGEPPMTGIVLGVPPLGVLEAPLLRQMPEAPELVFLNCCHLGQIGTEDGFGAALRQNRPGFAASLAVELIERGCSAVVACGWAVSDSTAKQFAQGLYQQLCGGTDYGTALRQARAEAYEASGMATNTWAAYQCYGHPGFVLTPATAERQGDGVELASPAEALAQVRAEMALPDAPGQRPLAERLAHLQDRIERAEWLDRSDLAAALGDGWMTCGQSDRAIAVYRRALAAEMPNLPLSSLQGSAVLLDGSDPDRPLAWVELLEALNRACQPSLGRHVLLARLFRQRAAAASSRTQRDKHLRDMAAALDQALALAGSDGDQDDALRLERLLAQALLSKPPARLAAQLAPLAGRLSGAGRLGALLALVQAVIGADPARLPPAAALRDPAGLLPLALLTLAALPARSPLRPALREALENLP
ncbi:CHAT domain-containing protein [Paracoccus sp. DMF]|uniref:CHAT domain-containing protein n=1 Tax=Paracoccus sp. DMF TaxID=400837 RepID=UPI0021E479F7|nr:CHAT domain-containing protein [Paracoccus sp. DMF]MCV2447223.1 CHAT domain-containing protein [Paracoccus sp. DMF]